MLSRERALFRLRGKIPLKLDETRERLGEVAERSSRQHDRVTAASDILGDFKEAPTLIFLQIEEKYLPLNRDFFGRERIIRGVSPWVAIHHKRMQAA
jgi:hypothetical protein